MQQNMPSWQNIADMIRQTVRTGDWKGLGAKLSAARDEWLAALNDASPTDYLTQATKPSMLRRCFAHDYQGLGQYMITITAADRKALPFGRVVGDPKVRGIGPTWGEEAQLAFEQQNCPTPQAGNAPQTVPQAGNAPQAVPQAGNAPQAVPQAGNAPQTVPQAGNAPQAVPQAGNAPQAVPLPPHVVATPLGMLMLEALQGIHEHYPMITLDKAQLMPDHLHFILTVTAPIVSANGRPTHLGKVIAGYKAGCNKARREWEEQSAQSAQLAFEQQNCSTPPTGISPAPAGHAPTTTPAGHAPTTTPAGHAPTAAPAGPTPTAAPAGHAPTPPHPSSMAGGVEQFCCSKAGEPQAASSQPQAAPFRPLWSPGYTDTIIRTEMHYRTECAYLDDNPRRLRIKQLHRDLFRTIYHLRAGGHDYAAIGNLFLLRQAWKERVQYHHWEPLCPPGYQPCSSEWHCQHFFRKETDGRLSYYTAIPAQPLPESEADHHTQRLLHAGDEGAVFVSPFISDLEKGIRDALLTLGCPYIRLTKEGFTDLYTPRRREFYACAEGNLLILAPWGDRKRRAKITRAECKELNQQALSLCAPDLELTLVGSDGFEQVMSIRDE